MEDVIVIGGGVAGLAAGRALTGRGMRVRLLEARDRLGGRIHSVREGPSVLEAGAEFVHGRPESTWDIIRAAQLVAVEVPDTHLHLIDGKARREEDFWGDVEKVMGRLSSLKRDMTFAGFLKHKCADVPERVRELARGYVEGFNAADARKISAIGLRQAEEAQEKIHADRNYRLVPAYDGVVDYLARGMDPDAVHLSTVVRRVKWKPGRVEVQTEHLGQEVTFVARRAVITLPIGVLQAKANAAGAVCFDPVPTAIFKAVEHLEMGAVLKIAISFREMSWMNKELKDAAFIHSQSGDAAFPTWWSMAPLKTQVMVGWAAGPAGHRLSQLDEAKLFRCAIDDLVRISGRSDAELMQQIQSYRVFNWQVDPFSRGAYSYVPVGGLDAVEQMSRPVKQTLYFAGEATDDQMSGTVAGAIASGIRASEQIAREKRR